MKNQKLQRFSWQKFEIKESIAIFGLNLETIDCFRIQGSIFSNFHSTHTMLILIVTISSILLARAFPYLADYITAATRR